MILLLVFLVSSVRCDTSAEDIVEDTENGCDDDQLCVKLAGCRFYKEKYDSLKTISRSEQKAVLVELKKAICNREERGFCCNETQTNDIITTSKTSPEAFENRTETPGLQTSNDTDHPSYLPKQNNCGVNPDAPPSKIFGGQTTSPGDYPWAALLGQSKFRKKTREKYVRWSCGGTLINKWYVVTAAHCQGKNRIGSRIDKVRLGEWTVSGLGGDDDKSGLPPEQDFDIGWEDVKVHKNYGVIDKDGKQNIVNDIALIKLPRMAELNIGVKLVCLPLDFKEYQENLGVTDIIKDLNGKLSTVVGWGYADGYNPWTNEEQGDFKLFGVAKRAQQYVELPMLSLENCTEINIKISLETSQICAGGVVGKDSCNGDSGGGLLLQDYKDKTLPWYLLGIVSYGSRVCGAGSVSVYTRVSYFINWIQTNIR